MVAGYIHPVLEQHGVAHIYRASSRLAAEDCKLKDLEVADD